MSKLINQGKRHISIDLTSGKKSELHTIKETTHDFEYKSQKNQEKIFSELKNKELIYKKINNLNDLTSPEKEQLKVKQDWNLPNLPKIVKVLVIS